MKKTGRRVFTDLMGLNNKGAIPADMVLYILESFHRAEMGLIGMRCYRDENGVLCVNWHNPKRTYLRRYL